MHKNIKNDFKLLSCPKCRKNKLELWYDIRNKKDKNLGHSYRLIDIKINSDGYIKVGKIIRDYIPAYVSKTKLVINCFSKIKYNHDKKHNEYCMNSFKVKKELLIINDELIKIYDD